MRIRYSLLMLVFILGAHVALTQDDSAVVCQALVEQAFAALEQNCSTLERGTACVGFAGVTAEGASLANPADRSPLTDLHSIQTGAFDADAEEWGVAVMDVPANVPAAMSGPAVTFLLLGDVSVENAVSADQIVQPGEPIEVTTLLGTNMRSGPSTDARVITSVGGGTPLIADALSADEAWLRVMYEDTMAWVSRDLVGTEGSLDSLPVITPDSMSPMQEFYFRSGEGGCDGAVPSLLVIQGPENMDVNLKVNGVDLRVRSTVALRTTDDNKMQVIVLSGGAYIGSLSIPAGFTMSVPLSEDGRSPAGDWENFRPLDGQELQQLAFMSSLPGADFLHGGGITIPTQRDIQSTLASLNSGGGGTSSGSAGPAAGQANCERFQPTSPLDGLAFGTTTFYWDAAPGATTYRLKIYSSGGTLLNSFDTTTDNTSLTVDTTSGSIGDGSLFGWEVDALVNGQVACTSGRVTIPRASAPVQVGGTGNSGAPTPTPVGWSAG